MKKLKTILVLFGVIGIWLSCDIKRKKECEGNRYIYYEFERTVSVSPSNDTIALGDTIWVEIQSKNPAYNHWNNKEYDISKATFNTVFNIEDLLRTPIVPIGDYITVDEFGNLASNTNPDGDLGSKVVLRAANDSTLYWKQGFILTRRGLFYLAINNFNSRSVQPNITECRFETVKFSYIFNGDSTAEGGNYHLLQYSLDEHIKSYS